MGDLTVRAWKRYGKDRLYISDTETQTSIGYYDRQTSKLHVDDPAMQYQALEALAPFLSGEVSALAHAVESAPPPPDQDLTNNVAGAEAAKRADELSQGRLQRFVAKLFGIRTEATSWEVGAAGERLVGDRLNLLKPGGWEVMHAIPLKSGADIDHLIIGPGGVFTINTKHHAGAQVRAKGDFVRVNGHLHPYVRNSRHEASAASRRLTAACGMAVQVTGVIAFVGAALLDVKEAPADVLIVPGDRLERLFLAVPRVLDAAAQRKIYSVARHKPFWKA